MGLRLACPRRAANNPAPGEADWIIVDHPAVLPVVHQFAFDHIRIRALWKRAIKKIIKVLVVKKLFTRLGRYLRDHNNDNNRTRRFTASSWSYFGRFLQKHKHIYRHGR